MWKIQPLSLDHVRACSELAERRGWLPEIRKWTLLLSVGRGYGAFNDSGDLIGTVVGTTYDASVCAISMMLVDARYERQGIGGALLDFALQNSGAQGAVLAATEFGRRLYERHGFRSVGVTDVFIGAISGRSLGDHQKIVRRAVSSDMPRIVDLDTRAFGTDRSEVIRKLPLFCDRFLVSECDGEVSGFAGLWDNGSYGVLGPLCAIYETDVSALLSALVYDWPGAVRVEVRDDWAPVDRWVKANGIPHHFSSTQMEWGLVPNGERSLRHTPVMLALG